MNKCKKVNMALWNPCEEFHNWFEIIVSVDLVR